MKYASVLILAACGASTPPAPTGNTAAETSQTAAACPASYAEVAVGAPCTAADGTTCEFPEGSCHCGSQSYCGGVAPSEEMLAELEQVVWQCEPKRTDGCPEQVPEGPCSTEGKICTYGDCCIQPATCTNGMWDVGQASCPP